MVKRIRERPDIPDHEVYRKIGGGAYGEVWLARSVTDALRAVKVVWRDDFDDQRTFEREFEGILKYEPVSRDHPGLVHILHVGRGEKDQVPFYYYVMELGDDVYNGTDISPAEYLARTVGSDLKEANGDPIDVATCAAIGRRLSNALAHLHEAGLAHRDVKPSNVIFVDGKAKLADIGLVATTDQQTFVGTEGFVPPEGPGSAQADVYSLGKVLYEMSTGKDRLDFPDPPDDPIPIDQRKSWLQLNQVICDVCNPAVSKRKISSAAELRDALQRIQAGKTAKAKKPIPYASTIGLLILVVMFIIQILPVGSIRLTPNENAKSQTLGPVDLEATEPEMGSVKILSSPLGADVYDEEQNYLGTTPLPIIEEVVGTQLYLDFKSEGYRTETWEGFVPREGPLVIDVDLETFAPPLDGQNWRDWMNNSFKPIGENKHLSERWIHSHSWQRFLAENRETTKGFIFKKAPPQRSNQKRDIIYTRPEMAQAYAQWLSETSLAKGFLTTNEQIIAHMDDQQKWSPSKSKTKPKPTADPKAKTLAPSNDGASVQELRQASQVPKADLKPTLETELFAFRCEVSKIPFGSLKVETIPNDGPSFIYINGLLRGVTPLNIDKIKPGTVTVELEREGHKRYRKTFEIKPHEKKIVAIEMIINQSVVFDKKWENSLGMNFVPIRENLMASIWETRVSDFQAFTKANPKFKRRFRSNFKQESNHPVVFVNREDAVQFCKWLTTKERSEERISETHRYRLPTDSEWSEIAGLNDEKGDWPAFRELQDIETFAWGETWPPSEKIGNFADQSTPVNARRKIPNYQDEFPRTAPVGSFPANAKGLFDIGGNVHEWVADNYSIRGNYGVTRGGGWKSYQKNNLRLIARSAVTPSYRNDIYGFRVIMDKTDPQSEDLEADDE